MESKATADGLMKALTRFMPKKPADIGANYYKRMAPSSKFMGIRRK